MEKEDFKSLKYNARLMFKMASDAINKEKQKFVEDVKNFYKEHKDEIDSELDKLMEIIESDAKKSRYATSTLHIKSLNGESSEYNAMFFEVIKMVLLKHQYKISGGYTGFVISWLY